MITVNFEIANHEYQKRLVQEKTISTEMIDTMVGDEKTILIGHVKAYFQDFIKALEDMSVKDIKKNLFEK